MEGSSRGRHVGQCQGGKLRAHPPWGMQAQIALSCTVRADVVVAACSIFVHVPDALRVCALVCAHDVRYRYSRVASRHIVSKCSLPREEM